MVGLKHRAILTMAGIESRIFIGPLKIEDAGDPLS